MGQEEDLVAQVPVRRHKEAGAVEEEAVLKAPRCSEGAVLQLLEESVVIVGRHWGGTNVVEEAKRQPREH
jgi:hypothetical protein